MDEVFGSDNLHAQLTFTKTRPLGSHGMPGIVDYILWYAKDINTLKQQSLFSHKAPGEGNFTYIELKNGERRRLSGEERHDSSLLDENVRFFQAEKLASSGYTPSCYYDIEFQGKLFPPKRTSWRTNAEGMTRLKNAARLYATDANIY